MEDKLKKGREKRENGYGGRRVGGREGKEGKDGEMKARRDMPRKRRNRVHCNICMIH
jgi:hypothetical protein